MQHDQQAENQEDILDLNEIMHAFGVTEWTNLGPLSPHAHDAHDANAAQLGPLNLLVDIHGQRYLLKERPEGLIGQDNQHRYAFRQYLANEGIPIAPLWLAPEGEPFVKLGEDAFELQQWRDGDSFDSTEPRSLARVAAAGEMLGRLHSASRRYPGPVYRWPSEVQAGGLTQGWLNFARAKAEQSEVYAVASALSHLVDAWEAVLPAAMMAIGTGRTLPEFHIHGDYSALNLRFRGQEVSEVLGLEASRWEKRLLELACGVFYFAGLQWRADCSLTRPLVKRGLEPERARLFLGAYGSVYPPVPGESPLLVDALTLIAPILTANGPLEDIFYGLPEIEDVLIEDVLERLAWAASLPSWLARVRRTFAEMW